MNKKFIYKNQTIDKKQLRKIILWAFTNYGITTVSNLVDTLKTLGFYYATQAGLSLSLEDLKIPPEKAQTLKKAYASTNIFNTQVDTAELTEIERFQRVINIWNQTSEDLKNQVIDYFKKTDPLNSIYIMAFSGARGNISQVRQLVGMRGLMADPNGEIIDLPITANFREGLKITDYLISSFGARKGLVDTALKTADSGYLTRRLVDVAQDIIIREIDCGTTRGIHLYVENASLLTEQLIGRILAEDLEFNNGFVLKKETELGFEILDKLVEFIPFNIHVYSSLTCKSVRATCQKCYGWNLATNKLVQLGEAVGVLAAQSIGEPGTQLTMRTFHTGGVFTGSFSNQIRAQASGQIIFSKNLKVSSFRTDLGKKAYLTQNSSEIFLKTYENKLLTIPLSTDSILFVENFSYVKSNSLIGELATKKESKAIGTKQLNAPTSGEIYLDKKYFSTEKNINTDSSGLLWLFSGDLYKVPYTSLFNLKIENCFLKGQALTQIKVTSNLKGKIVSTDQKSQNSDIQIKIESEKETLANLIFIKKVSSKNQLSTYMSKIFDLPLNLLMFEEQIFNSNQIFARSFLNKNTFTWSPNKILYSQNNKSFNPGSLISIPSTKPETLNSGIIVSVKNNISNSLPSLKERKTPNVIYLDLLNDLQYEVAGANLSLKAFNKLLKVENRIFYPGEIIFRGQEVTVPSLLKKHVTQNNLLIVLEPLEFYRIPKYEVDFRTSELKIVLHQDFQPLIKKKTNTKVLNFDLFINENQESFSLNNKSRNLISSKLNFRQESQKLIVEFAKEEIINLAKYDYAVNDEERLKLNLLVEKGEKTEIGGLVAFYELLSLKYQQIKNWKLRAKQDLNLFVTTQNDYQTIYTETNRFNFKAGDFIFKNNKISQNLLTETSGQIEKIDGNSITIKKAYPSLFSKGTFLFVSNNDFISKNTTLGLFLFEKTTTGDIVQGLPKVEEILEARKISNKGRLSKDFGVFLATLPYRIPLRQNQRLLPGEKRKIVKFFQVLLLTKNGIRVYRRLQNTVKDLDNGEFIYLNFPILNGINLHKLLYNYYKYFSNFNSIYETCYRSLRKIQVLIVSSIQQVYDSQGVSISDKHVELIVRQMSSKVQIANQGKTALRCGDIMDLENIRYINDSVYVFNQDIAAYIPVLNGITRASLKTESFISAASFQETTKVLTESAIEGKIDWLRGLKENVIVGRLIPAGTGFNIYNNLTTKKNISLPFYLKK